MSKVKISKEYYEKTPLFTPEELKVLKFTPEELATIEAADAFCDVSEVLPDDEKGMNALFAKIEKTFPNDLQGAFDKMGEITQKDPDFYRQLLALNSILNDVKEAAPAKVEKVNVGTVKNAKTADQVDAIIDALK